jgi:hypothetical protein
VKRCLALCAFVLAGCGTQRATSAVTAATKSCDASPAGRFQFACKDTSGALGEHDTDFVLTLDDGQLTVRNVTPGASATAGDFIADTAKFAPYQRRSSLDRSACRYQTAGKGTFYTYKIAAALFAGGKGAVSLYDDGGERMASAFFDCEAK